MALMNITSITRNKVNMRSGGNQKEKQGRKQSTQADATCKNHI